MKSIKSGKKKKIIVIAVIAAAAVILFAVIKTRTPKTTYTQDTAAKQDITVYHSFRGTVSAVNSQSVMSAVSGVKISEVDVKEGDMVKTGDVIAKLDTSTVDEDIKEKEITMSQAAKANALAIESAQKTYNDTTKNIADGLDTTRQGAQNGIDSAYVSLLTAANAYNSEVSLNNEQLSSTIMNAIQGVDSAARSLESAQLSTQQTKDALTHAQDEATKKGLTYDTFSGNQSIASSELSEESARAAYDNAVKSYKVAKISEENSLTTLFDQLITAQNSYFSAIDSYNAAIRGQEQQLDGYKLQIEQAQLSADDTLSVLQLENLKKKRDKDYVVTAPIGGQITKLNAKVGDITAVSATTSLAKITDYSSMKVDIKVGEYDITSLKEGDTVTVSVPAIDKEYKGSIKHIDREATSSNGVSYFNAEVEFKADKDIRAGLSAEVRLDVINLKGAVTVDNGSIMTDDDGSSYVYLKKDGQKEYAKQQIVCGATDGQYTEIKKGLKAGDVYYYDAMAAMGDLTESTMDGASDGESTEGAREEGAGDNAVGNTGVSETGANETGAAETGNADGSADQGSDVSNE